MTTEARCELWLKMLTFVGALAAALWTVYVYADTKEKEFYSAFWNKKMELYISVSEAASTLATNESLEEFTNARASFWSFFYGR